MSKGTKRARQADIDDEGLVREFLRGKQRSFDSLVMRYQDRVFNMCYRILGDYDEADDCAQDIFLKVFRSLSRFRFESKFSTWLYRITVNGCKNRLASATRRRNRCMVRLNGDPAVEAPGIEIRDNGSSPSKAFERKEREHLIQRAIQSLPDSQRVVVVLRDIEGLPYGEISKLSGMNPGTVKSKLARARRKLRKKLKGMI
jgi:RNA polymerase sigma-70 factor (ECF subfamily)